MQITPIPLVCSLSSSLYGKISKAFFMILANFLSVLLKEIQASIF